MTLDEFIKTASLRGLASKEIAREYGKGRAEFTEDDLEAVYRYQNGVCDFCKEWNDYKMIKVEPEFTYEYTAAIVSRLYKVGNPHSRGRSTNYGYGKFVLNYCPMCGRKLQVAE